MPLSDPACVALNGGAGEEKLAVEGGAGGTAMSCGEQSCVAMDVGRPDSQAVIGHPFPLSYRSYARCGGLYVLFRRR
jgi:hypothetical protein